jgi:hypothetical protein
MKPAIACGAPSDWSSDPLVSYRLFFALVYGLRLDKKQSDLREKQRKEEVRQQLIMEQASREIDTQGKGFADLWGRFVNLSAHCRPFVFV